MNRTDVLAGFVTDFRTEQRLYRMVRSLCARGFPVTAAGFREPGASLPLSGWDAGKLLLFPLRRSLLPGFLFFFLFMARLFRIAFRLKPRVYLACDLPALFPFMLAARLRGGTLLYDSREVFTELADVHRSPVKKALWGLMERLSVGKVKASMAVCDGDRAVLVEKYPSLKPVVVRNLPLFRDREPSDLIRHRLGLPPHGPVVLFQGTFLKSGGVADLALSAPLLKQGRIALIGDGPERRNVLSLIREKGLAEKVLWMPPVPFSELHALSCSADIGVFPPRPDGLNHLNALPNKIFEYAMAGLPVVSTDLPEIRKLNDCYDFALLVPDSSPENLAEAINRLASDPALSKRLRENALKMAKELCWENEENKFLALFEGL